MFVHGKLHTHDFYDRNTLSSDYFRFISGRGPMSSQENRRPALNRRRKTSRKRLENGNVCDSIID